MYAKSIGCSFLDVLLVSYGQIFPRFWYYAFFGACGQDPEKNSGLRAWEKAAFYVFKSLTAKSVNLMLGQLSTVRFFYFMVK